MRLGGAWLPLLLACVACGGDDSTAGGTPGSDAATGTGSGTGTGGGGAGVAEQTGGTAGSAGGVQGGAGADASSTTDAARDGKASGPCTGSADCNGGTCCSAANNARMCVASADQCAGLIYCKVPTDCPNMDHCCPQGFCGGCD